MNKEKYLNPFTDFGFKKLFGEEPNKDLLIDFLNQVLRDEQVKDLTYLKNEQLGPSFPDKRGIFDIYCENDKGDKFIVEMQKVKQKYFKDRSVYYSTFPIQQQAITGDWDFQLKAIYTIGILDFVFEEDKYNPDFFHWEVKLMETTKKTVFNDKLTYIYLELPKFNKTENDLITRFDKWLFVLKNLPKLDRLPAKMKDTIFEKLFKVAEISRFEPIEREIYEDSLKVYRDLKNTIDTAIDEASIKAKEKNTIEIAKKSLKAGLSVDIIIKITGLTKDFIENLKVE
ncbi:MAG: PD-(D/E)XK nuclease family transposase [Bacteroidales bacterium]|nr:PD-(D/E)XK nuclease family transposase [Bacteroidales bacterium]